MFDPGSIAAALGSAKAILELAKSANDLQLGIKIGVEVANVQGKLIDVQQQALALQQENQQLRAEIEKSKAYVHHHSVIWKTRVDGLENGPFCPPCLGEGKEMRLILWQQADQTRSHWLVYCPKGTSIPA